jgi:hypothetical protein
MSDREKDLQMEEKALEKLITLASKRGLRAEIEFEDQEVAVGDDSVVLNGKTVIEGREKE